MPLAELRTHVQSCKFGRYCTYKIVNLQDYPGTQILNSLSQTNGAFDQIRKLTLMAAFIAEKGRLLGMFNELLALLTNMTFNMPGLGDSHDILGSIQCKSLDQDNRFAF